MNDQDVQKSDLGARGREGGEPLCDDGVPDRQPPGGRVATKRKRNAKSERRRSRRGVERTAADQQRHVRRSSRYDPHLTEAEALVVRGWRELRAAEPERQPTLARLAAHVGIEPSALWKHIDSLIDKGWIEKAGRGHYVMRVTAAAQLHLDALLQIAVDVCKAPPCAPDDPLAADVRARHTAAYNQARATVRAILQLCRTTESA